mgnify:CR=1 FL=1
MNSLPFGQLKSFLKILIGVQYEKFFFLRPHLCQFVTECGNRHLFIHGWIYNIETSEIRAYDADKAAFRPLNGTEPIPCATPKARF